MLPRAGGLRSTVHVASRSRCTSGSRRVHRLGERGGPAPPRSPHRVTEARPPRRETARPVGPSHAGLITSQPRPSASRCYARHVNALKAHVKNGRIVVDQPTDLPEGTVLTLVPVEDEEIPGVAHEHMSAEEREALEKAIDEGLADADAGRVVDASVVLEKLRARSSA